MALSEKKKFLSTEEALKVSGYNRDYLISLCRAGSIVAEREGRNWSIDPVSLTSFIKTQKARKEKFHKSLSSERKQSYHQARVAKEDGLVGVGEALKLSGYNRDYLISLCRSGSVSAKQEGRKWRIDPLSLSSFVEQQKVRKEKFHESLSEERKQSYRAVKIAHRFTVLRRVGAGAIVVVVVTAAALSIGNGLPVSKQEASVATNSIGLGEKTALATYDALHGLFGSVSNLFTPTPRVSPAIVVTPATATTTTVAVATTTPIIAPTPEPKVVTVNSYPTYTTTNIVKGVSTDVLTQGLADLRTEMLTAISARLQPIQTQVATNQTSIQQVNMIQSLTDLILHTPKVDGATITNSNFTGGANLSATNASFDTLSAGTTALGTTTLTGDLTVSGTTTLANLLATSATTTNFFGTNLVATNATSTTLFATLAHATTGIVDTLTSTLATITGLTVTSGTTTNATSTTLFATNSVFTNATSTNLFATNSVLTNATSTNLLVSGTFSGVGLTTCSGSSDKLLWNSTTKTFQCGADAGAGGSSIALAGQYSSYQNGTTQTFATSSDTNIGLVITSASNTHTFTPTWIGTLADNRIASAAVWNAKQAALSFTYPLLNTANTISLAFGTTTANSWSNLQSFTNASSSNLSVFQNAYFGGTATSTFDSAGNLSLVSNGLTVGASQFVVSGGNVGIGTTTPSRPLHISGVNAPEMLLENTSVTYTAQGRDWGINNNGTGGSSALNFRAMPSDLSSNTIPLTLLSTGNVGIGTTSPSSPLTVSSTGATDLLIASQNAGNAVSLTFRNGSNISGAITDTGLSTLTTSYNGTTYYTINGATGNQYFTNSNVGIGTTSPGRLLDLYGSSSVTPVINAGVALGITNTDTTNNNHSDLRFATNDANGVNAVTAKILGIATSHTASAVSGDLAFVTTNAGTSAETMRITSLGSIGIGTTSPGSFANQSVGSTGKILDVTGTNPFMLLHNSGDALKEFGLLNYTGGAYIDSTGAATASNNSIHFRIAAGNSSTLPSEVVTILNTGFVGIGSTSPATTFVVNGVTQTNGLIRSTGGTATGATGPGLELQYSTGSDYGTLTSYNRTTSAYKPLQIDGSDVRLANSGTEYMRLTGGNVGIGNTAPSAKLSIGVDSGSVPTNTKIWIAGAGSGASTALQARINIGADTNTNYGAWMGEINLDGSSNQVAQFGTRVSGTDYPALNLNQGNVGIGTTSPNSTLTITNGNASAGAVRIGNDYASTYNTVNLNGMTGAGNYNIMSSYADTSLYINRPSGRSIYMGENNNENQFTILTGGNVGIGMTNPGAKLDILAGTNKEIQVYTPSSASGIADFSSGGVGWLFSEPGVNNLNSGIYTYNTSAGAKDNLAISARSDLVFQTGSNPPSGSPEQMRLSAGGALTLGTTDNSSSKFAVNGTGFSNYAIFSDYSSATFRIANDGSGNILLKTDGSQNLFMGVGGSSDIRVNASHNVGIGLNPSYKLDVNGDVNATNYHDSTGAYNVNLGSGGSEGRGLVAGYSGSSYGGIGYNIRHTASAATYIAPTVDTSSYLAFNGGGFTFQGAGSGSAGRTLSLTSLMTISSAGNVSIGSVSNAARLDITSADNTAGTNIGSFYALNRTQAVGIGYQDVRQQAAGVQLNVNAGTSGVLYLGNVSTGGVNIAAGGGGVTLTGNVSATSGTLTAGALRSNGNIYTDVNYGYGHVGVYSDVRYEGVYSMGSAYALSADGTSPGNLYGLAWTHSNIGGQSKGGLQHQLLLMYNGVTQTALGSGIWTNGTVTIGGSIQLGTYGAITDAPTSYGNIGFNTTKNGYYGITMGNSTTHANLMYDGSGNGGIYYQGAGLWAQYYNKGTNHLSINTSADLGYTLGVNGTMTAGGINSSGTLTASGITTLTNQLYLDGGWAQNGAPNYSALQIRGSYPSMEFRSSTSNSTWLYHMSANGYMNWYNDPNSSSGNSWSNMMQLSPGGDLSMAGVLYAGLPDYGGGVGDGENVCWNPSTHLFSAGSGGCFVSTRKVKNNIAPLPASVGLADILKLQPVNFRYLQGFGDNGSSTMTGFIAEDTAVANPLFALYATKPFETPNGTVNVGEPQSINWNAITTASVLAIQQLDARTQILTASSTLISLAGLPDLASTTAMLADKLASQETRVTSLEARVAVLESGAISMATTTIAQAGQSFTSTLSAELVTAMGGVATDSMHYIGASFSAGIGAFSKIFAGEVHTDKLCVTDGSGETCVTKAQLDTLLGGSGNSGGGSGSQPPADTTPPVVTLVGDSAIQLTVGDTYTEQGATALDDVSGDVTSSIVVTGSVDIQTAGVYTLTYTATDSAGNAGSIQRTVTVN